MDDSKNDSAGYDLHEHYVYLPVRAKLFAAQADEDNLPAEQWFGGLARAGLTGLMADADRDMRRDGVAELLSVAEVFGGYDVPASYVPLAAATRVLARAPFAAAQAHLGEVLDGGAPVMPALQSAPSTVRMGAGGGLKAEREGGGWRVSGTKYAVPGGDIASGFIVDAKSEDGTLLFFVPCDAPGLTVEVLPGVDGTGLAALAFEDVELAPGFPGAVGKPADDLLDDVRFAVQLGLAMQLCGQASAMLVRAGAAGCPEERIAECLMQVMLSRALTSGAARLAQAGRPHALELIAGARAAAQDVAVSAARVAIPYCSGDGESASTDRLTRRIIVASRIYSQNAAHMDRFAGWRWGKGAGPEVFGLLAGAIPVASAGSGAPAMDDAGGVDNVLALLQEVRAAAEQSGAAELQPFRHALARVEQEIFALVAVRRQMSVESGYTQAFVEAATRRVMSQLADFHLRALGSAAAMDEHAAAQFTAVHKS